jgi:5'-phosphate synthase pdxT subunit
VVVRQGRVVLCAFHPELTDDSRLHALLMALATSAREGSASDRQPAAGNEP